MKITFDKGPNVSLHAIHDFRGCRENSYPKFTTTSFRMSESINERIWTAQKLYTNKQICIFSDPTSTYLCAQEMVDVFSRHFQFYLQTSYLVHNDIQLAQGFFCSHHFGRGHSINFIFTNIFLNIV